MARHDPLIACEAEILFFREIGRYLENLSPRHSDWRRASSRHRSRAKRYFCALPFIPFVRAATIVRIFDWTARHSLRGSSNELDPPKISVMAHFAGAETVVIIMGRLYRGRRDVGLDV